MEGDLDCAPGSRPSTMASADARAQSPTALGLPRAVSASSWSSWRCPASRHMGGRRERGTAESLLGESASPPTATAVVVVIVVVIAAVASGGGTAVVGLGWIVASADLCRCRRARLLAAFVGLGPMAGPLDLTGTVTVVAVVVMVAVAGVARRSW